MNEYAEAERILTVWIRGNTTDEEMSNLIASALRAAIARTWHEAAEAIAQRAATIEAIATPDRMADYGNRRVALELRALAATLRERAEG